jgi:hypothetical protein
MRGGGCDAFRIHFQGPRRRLPSQGAQRRGVTQGRDVPVMGTAGRPCRVAYLEGRRPMAEDGTRKRLLAIDVLLEEPDEISDGLEAELYALRDRLHLIALRGS